MILDTRNARATRASDEDRERVATRLKDDAAAGRLSLDELSERLDTAYSARTLGELESLFWDLPEQTPVAAVKPFAVARGDTSAGRIALIAVLVLVALAVVPGVIFPVLAVALVGFLLLIPAAFLLAPFVLIGAGVWGAARLARGSEPSRPRLP